MTRSSCLRTSTALSKKREWTRSRRRSKARARSVLPVLATTLSLLAVFIPVGFMTRHRRPFYVVVWTDGRGGDRRFADRFVYADADARGPLDQTAEADGGDREYRRRYGRRRDPRPRAIDDSSATGPEAQNRKPRLQRPAGFISKVDGTYTWLLKLAMRSRWAVVLICVMTVASIVPALQICRYGVFAGRGRIAFPDQRSRAAGHVAGGDTVDPRPHRPRRSRSSCPGSRTRSCSPDFGGGSGPNNGFINVSLDPVAERSQFASRS